MRKTIGYLTLFISLVSALNACGPASGPASGPTTTATPAATEQPAPELLAPDVDLIVQAGQPFLLAVGQDARLTGQNMVVQFVGVVGDSRCPSDVLCIMAGWVEVKLEVRIEQQPATLLILSTETEAMPTVQVGDYMIQLQQVEPYPISTRQIQPKDYQVTLTIQ